MDVSGWVGGCGHIDVLWLFDVAHNKKWFDHTQSIMVKQLVEK